MVCPVIVSVPLVVPWLVRRRPRYPRPSDISLAVNRAVQKGHIEWWDHWSGRITLIPRFRKKKSPTGRWLTFQSNGTRAAARSCHHWPQAFTGEHIIDGSQCRRTGGAAWSRRAPPSPAATDCRHYVEFGSHILVVVSADYYVEPDRWTACLLVAASSTIWGSFPMQCCLAWFTPERLNLHH